jgi:hypothetical protein
MNSTLGTPAARAAPPPEEACATAFFEGEVEDKTAEEAEAEVCEEEGGDTPPVSDRTKPAHVVVYTVV